MNTLKYQHLFAERGEEEDGDAPGNSWQDKATPGRRLSASPQPHDAITPASLAPQPHTDPAQQTPQETPEPEQQMSLSGFSAHPFATAERDAVGSKGGRATALEEDSDDTAGTQPTPQHHGSQSRKVHQVSGYMTAPEFAEVERLRGSGTHQLTRGAVVTKLIRTGLKGALDTQHAEMLEPRLAQTMTRLFEAFVNRFMRVMSETYYTAKAGDIKLTDLMSLAYGSNTADFHKKVADAEKEARLSLTRRKAVEKHTPEEEEEGEGKARQAEE
jgi:hypothetical protein